MSTPSARARGPSARRGNLTLLLALALVVLVGFAALAIDVSWVRLAQTEAQDAADAASLAGALTLRRTGDPAVAEAAAREVLARNRVAGEPPELLSWETGAWSGGAFDASASRPHAVSVSAGRTGAGAVPFFLARVLGLERAEVLGQSRAATRASQFVLVLDIGADLPRAEVRGLRDAARAFAERAAASASPEDTVALVLSQGRRAWVHTPRTLLSANPAAAWSDVDVASRAGPLAPWPTACSPFEGRRLDDFASPPGGCVPTMPRAYHDEVASDPATALRLATSLLDPAGPRFQGVVLLTARSPGPVSLEEGRARAADGFRETRWIERVGRAGRTAVSVRAEAEATLAQAWDAARVHAWVLRLGPEDGTLTSLPRGRGNHQEVRTAVAARLAMEDLAASLPVELLP